MILVFGRGYSQSNTFTATFKSLVNGEPVLYAKVTNSHGESLLTNVDGLITIDYEPESEITISHLVYDTLRIMPSEFVDRKALFDRKFVSNDLGKSDADKVREKLRIIEMKKELIGLDRSAQGGAVLGSPITYLYDRFSKSGRERREYAMLLAKDKQRRENGKKFDDFVVSTLTSFENEELARFKVFCSFHPSFIEMVDELTLYYEILRCRTEFIEKEY